MRPSTKIVGILNVTPDSFSDGGLAGDEAAIIASAEKLIKDGTDVIDIGAESTRPGAAILTSIEEWQRLEVVLPQICKLAKESGVLVSVDTRNAKTAANAIDCGVDWINDVTGAGSSEMLEILSNWQGKVVIMHNLGVPADKKNTLPEDSRPVEQVRKWLCSRLNLLEKNGISKNRVIIDPGIGFGKTAAQSWQLLGGIEELQSLGADVLVGHSRKSFIDFDPKTNMPLPKTNPEDRDAQTLEISRKLALQGINYLRVHDVKGHVGALTR